MVNQKKPSVLLLHPLPREWISLLDGEITLLENPDDNPDWVSHFEAHLARAEGILSFLTDRIDQAVLEKTSKLSVVSNMAVGVDNIDIHACSKRGIPVGNTPGAMTEATADLTFALILAAARQLVVSSSDAREGRWQTWSPTGWLGSDLSGSILGIIGLGKIGKAVARRARGFGMKIVYWEPDRKIEAEKEVNAVYLSKEELLATSDIVTLHCPLNDTTRGLIDEAALRRMKPTAILINAARGPVIDTGALVRALSEKWILSAALDVTDPEPLPPTHPLFSLQNCFILPHIGSATFGTRKRMAEMACENLLAGLAGKRLPNCVNPDVYPREGTTELSGL